MRESRQELRAETQSRNWAAETEPELMVGAQAELTDVNTGLAAEGPALLAGCRQHGPVACSTFAIFKRLRIDTNISEMLSSFSRQSGF